MYGLPSNLTDLDQPYPIYFLTKANNITRGPTIDVSNSLPVLMIHMIFALFNVEAILVFNSAFVAICLSTSHPFDSPSIISSTPMENSKLPVTALINQENKVVFVRVDEYVTMARS